MILLPICFLALIQSTLAITCYTCNDPGFFCSLPLNVEGGDISNENDVNNPHYSHGFVCQSDHYIDSETGEEKLILRGTPHCVERDEINHRTRCCDTNNCNKWAPNMRRQARIPSSTAPLFASMLLIGLSAILSSVIAIRN